MIDPQDRLDGWKEIAGHLGRDVTTAIRWERERGLPVHRLPGSRRSAVFAYRQEIDAWQAGRAIPAGPPVVDASGPQRATPANRSVPRLAAGGALLVLVGVAGFLVPRLRGSAAPEQPRIDHLELEAHAVVARADDGAEIWRHTLPQRIRRHDPIEGTSPWYVVTDLDGSGAPEAVASLPLATTGENGDSYDELFAFSADGRVLWRQRLMDQFTFRGGTFGPPWSAGHVAAYHAAGELRIAWAQGHHTWWPSPLVVVDSAGRRLATFVHPGQIRALRVIEVAGRPLVLGGGVANASRGAFMMVLDGASITGQGPAPPGSPYECVDCPAGRPLRYFVFPPSDICRASEFPYNYTRDFVRRGDEIEAFTRESLPGAPLAEMVFRFGSGFELVAARSADSWVAHETLQRHGKLDHDAAHCPWYRDPPPVRAWAPDGSWVDLRPGPPSWQLAQR